MITNDYGVLPLSRLVNAAEQIQVTCRQNHGARIGESTVVSKKLHIYQPQLPQEIQIVQNIDAGQLFYNQQHCDMIFHMDIFHQCGQVSHYAVARAMKEAVAIYNHRLLECDVHASLADPNLVDIQTNSGGGRITGNLSYGQKLTLRKAHINHVHITAMLSDEHTSCLLYLVLAVENVILTHGLELRCVEKIIAINNHGNQLMDLSEYTDQTDSMLKSIEAPVNSLLTTTRHESPQESRENQFLPSPLEHFSDSAGSVKQAVQRPNNIQCNKQTLLGLHCENGFSIIQHLPFLQKKSQLITPILLPDGELHLRRILATMRRKSSIANRGSIQNNELGNQKWHTEARTIVDSSSGLFDITDTVHAAVSRMVIKHSPSLTMNREDLRFQFTHLYRKCDVCFVIDASASMEGTRLLATKSLVLRLLRTAIRQISVIAFQGDNAQISIPFTRNCDSIKFGIDSIHAHGSTPLALGIKTCLDYLQKTSAHRPLIVLITDGLPSSDSNITSDPLKDALTVARDIKKYGYYFTCVGLAPQQYYLASLAEAAGGSLYICQT